MKKYIPRITVANHFVTMTSIVKYAGAAGDFTPIHHDPELARSYGYEKVFAMGMLSAGFLASLVEKEYGTSSVISISFRFIDKTWVGDQVTCTVSPLEQTQLGLHLDLLASVEDRATIKGLAVVRI